MGKAPARCGPASFRVAYQDFFALWKDAYPDVPILKQARAEYPKAAIAAGWHSEQSSQA
jgi:hypothetical protein